MFWICSFFDRRWIFNTFGLEDKRCSFRIPGHLFTFVWKLYTCRHFETKGSIQIQWHAKKWTGIRQSSRIFRGWLHDEFKPGLKFQPSLLSWDFTSASWTNLLIKTFAITCTWRDFQPRLKLRKPDVIALKFQPGLKKWGWACLVIETVVSHFSSQFQISARA